MAKGSPSHLQTDSRTSCIICVCKSSLHFLLLCLPAYLLSLLTTATIPCGMEGDEVWQVEKWTIEQDKCPQKQED